MEMERQESGSSSISLNSWGSDLAEEARDEYTGFQFNGLQQNQNQNRELNREQEVEQQQQQEGHDQQQQNLHNHHSHQHQHYQMMMPQPCNRASPANVLIQTQALCHRDMAAAAAAAAASPSPNPSLFLSSASPSSSSSSDPLDMLLSQRPPMSQTDKEWSSYILMMKERYAKLLLGEDFSGGSKGSNTALTISNAITKLSVAIFGDLWRLEPLSREDKLKWKREMEWLISPCDYIVELVPTAQSLQDGTTVAVMASKPRSDVYVGLPALQKLDGMLLEILESFKSTEFWYADSVHERPSNAMTRESSSSTSSSTCEAEEVWIPVAKVASCGLSERARRHLSSQRESANQILKAAKSINEHVLSEMEVPESYWKTLPKSGKKVMMEESPLKIITSEYCCFEALLSTLEYPSYRSLSSLANGLESLIQVWTLKIRNRIKHFPHPEEPMSCRAAPTWVHLNKDASSKKVELKRKYVERAQSLLSELRHRFPGLLQTSLELSKIQHNKDVGYAVLESYSRVLVNLAARIQTRIGEVISADKDAVLSRLQSLNANAHCKGLDDGPLRTSPGRARLVSDGLRH